MKTNYFIPVTHKNIFNQRVMIFDKDNIISNMLVAKHIKFKICDALSSETFPYYVLFCDIPKYQCKKFIKVMQYAPVEMGMHGYSDYEDFCLSFQQQLEEHHRSK